MSTHSELTSFPLSPNNDDIYSVSNCQTRIVPNEGDDALYVPDPDKMGSSLFHYYTNGAYLESQNDVTPISGEYGPSNSLDGPEPYDSWNVEWFTKMDSHQSMRRTVVGEGY
jgi:hypothetical protein